MPDDDDLREPDEKKDNAFPIAIVIAVVVTVLLVGSAAAYVNAVTSSPPTGSGIPSPCSTACAMWVKIDCPGGKIVGMCTWDHPITFCGAPIHPCGTNPPPPP
jgi:hypothetical protein